MSHNKIISGPEIPENLINRSCLGEFFMEACDKYSDKICQVNAVTGETETYASAKLRGIRLALELKKRGLKKGDIILVCMESCIDNLIPVFGASFLAAKASFLDPLLGLRYCKHGIEMVKPKFIFTGEKSVKLIEDSLEDIKDKPEIVVVGKSAKGHSKFSDFLVPKENEDKFKVVPVDSDETAFIYFSSGTTGMPKGIQISSFGILNHNNPAFYGNPSTFETILHFTSLYWVTAAIAMMFAFNTGGRRVVAPCYTPDLFLKTVEKYKVTLVIASPAFMHNLISHENLSNHDLSSLVYTWVTGTKATPQQMADLRKSFPKCSVVATYGCTESSGAVTFFSARDNLDLYSEKLATCGRISPGIKMKVVDIKTGDLLGPNEPGEIRIKSPFVMKGYFNQDSRSAFDDEGYYKTGDVGYYDEDQCFYITDRIKEMFKHKSWHVQPSLVEGVLLEHPAVKQAAVFGIPHPKDGEQPAACIVLEDGYQVSVDEIHEHVNEQVSEFHRLVGGIKFVRRLPTTSTGKLQRNAVKEGFLNGTLV